VRIQRQREAFAYRGAAVNGDLDPKDVDLLADIADNRTQRESEQRTAGAEDKSQRIGPKPPKNTDAVKALETEFYDWWDQSGRELNDPKDSWNGERGPLGHWPYVEDFLKERYPVAWKGNETGLEQTGRQIDHDLGRGPGDEKYYHTGPQAVAQHGYDPAEIAATMLLLHSQTHPFRRDFDDQRRLTDIIERRERMRREYEADPTLLQRAMQQRSMMPPAARLASPADHNGQTTYLTEEDMDNLQWDWGKGRWVPRPSGEDRLVPAREERNFNYEGRWPGWEHNASRRLTAVWDYVDVPEEERGDWDDEDWENYHAEVDAGGLKPTKGEYPIVDQIHDEFNDWWDKGGTPGKNYDPDALDDGVKRGPIGHWPTVENFLKDRYPAAYRGLGYGWEEAKAVLDGEDIYRFPQGITNYRGYETGQDAIDRHGYDPKEVASAMMYLHNLSRGIDGSYDHHRGEDGARLWNIFQKRLKMQRDYERRSGGRGVPHPAARGMGLRSVRRR